MAHPARSAARSYPTSDRDQVRLADVRAAVEGAAFQIAMQPVVSLPDLRICGVEALARFPTRPNAPVPTWLARADATGLGRRLELLLVAEALRHWQSGPIGQQVAVNVSTRTLVDPSLLTVLLDADVGYGSVVIEITEHACVDDDDEALAAIARLRAAGASIALDDVGAGFASLDLVRRLRPDIVKLDSAVVAALRTEPAERLIAGAAVRVAREIDAAVFVEGIETLGDLRGVQALGADFAQGYYFGEPSTDPADWECWAALGITAATAT